MHHTKQLSHSSILFIGTSNQDHSDLIKTAADHTSNRSTLTLIVTITLSASLTLLNKSIYTTFEFPYPFHLLALHFASISLTSRIVAKTLRPKELDSYHERVTWRFWSRNVLTVGLAYGSAILCSNLAYLSLSVSFVQMLVESIHSSHTSHSHCIPRPQITTDEDCIVVMTISSGVAIAAYGEIQFVLIGVLFQFVGSLAEVARLIATQRLLQDLNVDPLVALSVLSPVSSPNQPSSKRKLKIKILVLQICFAMAIVLAPIFEGTEPIFMMVPKMGIPLISGSIILALALNIVVLFLVSSTNAWFNSSGIVKDICLILGSVIFLGRT
ncbi:hypothetical protein PSHT_14537 [Puccinia striiformis]|uniref:Sugar phosphate transporter domain-containing protein n=1 Tax=Puccinia striiformis TaxID=27350 RepID=A0A2S4UJN9_9BASI|nr:hypothetical protein PSHT_14537 [Puccinia striiformis]